MRLFSIVSAAAIAVAAVAATPDASAQRNRNNQSTTAVVINYQRVLTESAIGRDLQSKLQTVRTQINTEAQSLAPERQSIDQEAQRLQNTLRNQSAEQIRNNPQAQALAQRQQQFQTRAATLQAELECTQLIALRDVDQQIDPVVRSVMQSRGAGIAIDARNVSQSAPEFDITAAVIQQLDGNQATRTASVSRRQVSDCAGQQQQAGAPAAGQ
ncbi:MAG TPA: OmpH family outer membrane protein [Vitreimonas sp.]|uniref:OmpH family outer membrane protein n=1 Tax=Vitreimonas sp. TaxID=3069702 RepID=UPI002D2CF93D|nr:OmpH family outer membrane protein [Vitreimonas sp.]HYD87511.1 OmpH family outer membrane protein [Vitreimonas sp.]